jgi:hypothetical protein
VTLYLQKKSPGKVKESNWLPDQKVAEKSKASP